MCERVSEDQQLHVLLVDWAVHGFQKHLKNVFVVVGIIFDQ